MYIFFASRPNFFIPQLDLKSRSNPIDRLVGLELMLATGKMQPKQGVTTKSLIAAILFNKDELIYRIRPTFNGYITW